MPEQFQKEMVIVVSYNLCRTSIGDRIFFNSIIDKRYKTNRVSVNLILPLERDKVSVRALIPNILPNSARSLQCCTALISDMMSQLSGTVR